MKVAIVQSTPLPAREGIGVYTTSLAMRLAERGHEVVLVTRRAPGEAAEERLDGLRVVRPAYHPVYPIHVHLHAGPVSAALARERPDIVHIHSPLAPPVTAGRPTVATFHSLMGHSVRRRSWREPGTLRARLQTPVSRRIEQRLARAASVLTVVSESRRLEAEGYGFPRRPLHVIPSGVDLRRFVPAAVPPGPPRLLCVGRLAPAKGMSDLVDALPAVRDRFPDAQLDVVGDGPLMARLRERAARRGVRDAVTWHARVPHERLPALHGASHVFVHPSHYEGMPTAILEAMACGRPVVGCRVPGTSDIVEPGVTGSLVPAGRPDALAQAITAMLDDDNAMRTMGQAARRKVEADHDWDDLASRFEVIYAELMEETP